MIRKGEIPTVRIGERILIPATWVEQFMLNADKVVAAKTMAAKA